jgi:hypothetical protein
VAELDEAVGVIVLDDQPGDTTLTRGLENDGDPSCLFVLAVLNELEQHPAVAAAGRDLSQAVAVDFEKVRAMNHSYLSWHL